jgi:hypothetical protein
MIALLKTRCHPELIKECHPELGDCVAISTLKTFIDGKMLHIKIKLKENTNGI